MGQRLFPHFYEGWVVVVASAILYLLVGASLTYGFGAIFNEVIDEFAWSVAATAFAFSLRSEVGGIAAPLVGAILDRVGAQKVIAVGVIVSATGTVLMSLIQNLWQFYVAMLVISAGVSAAGSQVGLAATATWFERRRARAMAIMTVGGGLGGLLAIFLAALVEEYGWRQALRFLAAFMLVAGLAISTLTRSRPDDHSQPMDGVTQAGAEPVASTAPGEPPPRIERSGMSTKAAIRSQPFVLLTFAMIAYTFATNAVVVHQLPYLEIATGVSKSVAGSTVLVFTLTSILGRLGLGFLADRYPKRAVASAAAVLVAVGLLVLATASTFTMAIIGVMIVAPGYGAMMPVRPALFADYFGTRHFGAINGTATLIAHTGGALGPWVVGLAVDASGGYAAGWYLSATLALMAVPLFLIASPPAPVAVTPPEVAVLPSEVDPSAVSESR